MGSSPQPPSVPSYQDVSANQQTYNVQDATKSQAGSMINQSNPYGYLSYTANPNAPGGYTASMGYSGPEQNIFNTAQTAAGYSGSVAPTFMGAGAGMIPAVGFNTGQSYGAGMGSNALIGTGLGEIASGGYGNGNNIPGQTAALTGQMMGNELSSLSPFFTMQNDQLNTRLQNEGLMPGTDAYNNAERQQSFNQGLTMENAAAQFQPQAYSEAVNNYMLPATLGAGLIGSGANLGGLSQGYTSAGQTAANTGSSLFGTGMAGLTGAESMTPSLSGTMTNTPQLSVSAPNVVGAANTYDQAMLGQYQAQMAQQNAMYQALGSVGGGLLGGWARGGFPIA